MQEAGRQADLIGGVRQKKMNNIVRGYFCARIYIFDSRENNRRSEKGLEYYSHRHHHSLHIIKGEKRKMPYPSKEMP